MQVIRLVHYRLVPYNPPVIIDENIPHYGKNPPLEIRIVNVFIPIVQRLQCCVLQQIVSVISVCCERISEVKQAAL
jgi:hypothetical protein